MRVAPGSQRLTPVVRSVEAMSFAGVDGGDPTRFTGVREKALSLREATPYALSSTICGVTYEICWYMRGLERWFVDMIENPAVCEALLDDVDPLFRLVDVLVD